MTFIVHSAPLLLRVVEISQLWPGRATGAFRQDPRQRAARVTGQWLFEKVAGAPRETVG